MGDSNATPDDDDGKDQRADGSDMRTWARGLYTMMGGDPANFDAAWDDVLGGERAQRIDDVAARGIGLGGRMAAAQRRQGQEPRAQAPGPKVHMREVHVDGEFVGLRVLSSDGATKVYAGDGELFIVTDTGQEPHPIGFDVGRVEQLERESMAEFLVFTQGTAESAMDELVDVAESATETFVDDDQEGREGGGEDDDGE